MTAHPLTKKSFSLLPFSFSSSLLVTFFSAARTMPDRYGGGYFFSRSALASASFFLVASDFSGAADDEEAAAAAAAAVEVPAVSSTAMASVESAEAVNGLAEVPAARMPTTVPAWPGDGRYRGDRQRAGILYHQARGLAGCMPGRVPRRGTTARSRADSLILSRAYSTWYSRPSGEKMVLSPGDHRGMAGRGSWKQVYQSQRSGHCIRRQVAGCRG